MSNTESTEQPGVVFCNYCETNRTPAECRDIRWSEKVSRGSCYRCDHCERRIVVSRDEIERVIADYVRGKVGALPSDKHHVRWMSRYDTSLYRAWNGADCVSISFDGDPPV